MSNPTEMHSCWQDRPLINPQQEDGHNHTNQVYEDVMDKTPVRVPAIHFLLPGYAAPDCWFAISNAWLVLLGSLVPVTVVVMMFLTV